MMASSITQPGQPTQRRRESRGPIFWGLLLIAAGLVFLTMTLGLVPNPTGSTVGVAFAVVGFVLLASYVVLHTHWWTLIAGPTLLAIGAVILLPGNGGGAIFLGGIGLGFALLALTSAERWWAVIPAGTLVTLALVSLLSATIGGLLAGSLLFFGLAVTFGVLAVIRIHGRNRRWPLIPAAACVAFGALIATSGQMGDVVWPILLIAAGLALLAGPWIRRRS